MGIINRTLDITEQKSLVSQNLQLTATGSDYVLFQAPRAMQVKDAYATVVGLSGTPTGILKLQRFVAGVGLTTISISGTLTHTAIGTSGAQRFSMPATGSSLLDLQSGDFLVLTTGGTNAGVTQALVQVVVQSLQDFKTWYGI